MCERLLQTNRDAHYYWCVFSQRRKSLQRLLRHLCQFSHAPCTQYWCRNDCYCAVAVLCSFLLCCLQSAVLPDSAGLTSYSCYHTKGGHQQTTSPFNTSCCQQLCGTNTTQHQEWYASAGLSTNDSAPLSISLSAQPTSTGCTRALAVGWSGTFCPRQLMTLQH